ncbi:uncharacterized protein YutE (UPF0331/DUF86 family) [Fontibacillus solani]|uniref:Uncharacterized protein YutE (UPF0331/DUF86 family) n=1 Tax=Fontibacillus solani TaxID=1572857 RepID=A0A7W3XS91_9BACL|nr:HepT-like ribonuclease domain-containing protein [Fontibacillus solani]MBA9086286.1 uncharacterized protein YutE (UPF0331/DUF86 family) [Fontibacillus solani]
MYYVNREQIEHRLHVIPELVQVLESTTALQDKTLIERYAEERSLHLAIEIVTDVGSYLIDGFIMRDASSYEDIVNIMYDEKVIDENLHKIFTELVRMRRPLVQEYFDDCRKGYHELTVQISASLERFSHKVLEYLDKEGIPT